MPNKRHGGQAGHAEAQVVQPRAHGGTHWLVRGAAKISFSVLARE